MTNDEGKRRLGELIGVNLTKCELLRVDVSCFNAEFGVRSAEWRWLADGYSGLMAVNPRYSGLKKFESANCAKGRELGMEALPVGGDGWASATSYELVRVSVSRFKPRMDTNPACGTDGERADRAVGAPFGGKLIRVGYYYG